MVLVHSHLPDRHERGRGRPEGRPLDRGPGHGRGEPPALHRRDAGGGGVDARGAAGLAGPLRRGLLVPPHPARRRSLGARRPCRRLPGSDLLDGGSPGHAVGPGGGGADRRRPGGRRPLARAVRRLRAQAPEAVSPLPALRRRLLRPRVPRPLLHTDVPLRHLRSGPLRVGRQLAAQPGDAAAPRDVLRPGRVAARAPHRGPLAQRGGLVGTAPAHARTGADAGNGTLDGGTLDPMAAHDANRTNPKKLIVTTLNLDGLTPERIADDEPLFGTGLGLDSVDALELVVALEKEYGISIASHEVDRSVFGSLASLAGFVERRLAERKPQSADGQ